MDERGSGAAEQQLRAANQQLKAAEEELRRQNKFLGSVLDSLTHPFCVINADDYRVEVANSAATPGRLPDDMTCYMLYHKLDRPCKSVERPCAIEQIKKTKKPVTVEHVRYGEKGKARNIEIHGYPLFDSFGNISRIIEYSIDVTERRRAERLLAEEHGLLRTLIDNMPDLIYIKDAKGRFVIANKGVARFMGATNPDELLGKTDFDFYHKEPARQFYDDEQTVVQTARPLLNRQEHIASKSGDAKWILTTKVPWQDADGNTVGVVGIGRDITARKKAEDALKAANQQLAATNQQLRAGEQQLKAANQQLQASEQQLKAANQQLQASEQQLKATNQQLQASEQQLKAANQQLAATNQQLRAGEEDLQRLNHTLHKRINQLNCLYEPSRLDKDRQVSLDKIFGKLVNAIPDAWEYPEAAVARITFDGRVFETENFRRSPWSQYADITVDDQKLGTIQVCYLEQKPDVDEGPFFIEERNLLDALAEHLGEIAERKAAEQKLLKYQAQLKSLASQLSLSEEYERRRIATELHDRISQELVISKVKLEALRESAASGHFAEDLGEITGSLDRVIQNTRSLTFDLSSPILHELGFEAAVEEWLAEQIHGSHGITAEFHSDRQPKPLGDNVSILLFRDVRELLINVVKHSRADTVTVSSRKVGNQVHVSVEDNGVGFNLSEVASVAAETGGFGLFSIRERLEQIGGRLEIASEPGRGTTVTIIAPLKQGGKGADRDR